MSFEGAEADRRIGNMVQIGQVTSVTGDGTARVQIGDLATRALRVMALRAGGMQVWWMPTVGEQVMVLAPSGDMARAVIVGSLMASNEPSGDETVPVIDLRGGDMIVRGNLKIEGTLHIDGTQTITGDLTGDTDIVASGISLVTHVHKNVSPGPAKSGEPE